MKYILTTKPNEDPYKSATMYFGFCDIKREEDTIRLTISGGMQQCRGFLNDSIVPLKKGCKESNYVKNLNFLTYKRVYVLIKNYHNEDNLLNGVSALNKQERKHRWFRTQVKDLGDYKLLIASKNWFVNLMNMSLFMLIVRNVIGIEKKDYSLEDVYNLCKDVGDKHNVRYFDEDKKILEMVSRNVNLINFIMKNNKEINETFSWKDIKYSHSVGVGELLKWFDQAVNKIAVETYNEIKPQSIKEYGLEKYIQYIQDNKSAIG